MNSNKVQQLSPSSSGSQQYILSNCMRRHGCVLLILRVIIRCDMHGPTKILFQTVEEFDSLYRLDIVQWLDRF